MSLPPDFSPATFLYLNPEVSAFSNVTTVEDAVARYPSEFSNLYYRIPDPALHGPFVDDVYIAEYRGVIDVSHLNHVINVAESNILGSVGVADETDGFRSRYVPNFYRKVVPEGDGFVFRLATPPFASSSSSSSSSSNTVPASCSPTRGVLNTENLTLNASNLRVGDEVRILRGAGEYVIDGHVSAIVDSNAFRLNATSPPTWPSSDNGTVFGVDVTSNDSDVDYVLFGIRVSDPDRVAHINYTRRFHAGFSNEAPTQQLEPFNAELYQTLYPDARFLTEDEAFVSSRNNWTTNDVRITKAQDIVSASYPVLSELCLTSNLHLGQDVTLTWSGTDITGISTDSVSPSEQVLRTTLITEHAIKKYVERPYETVATFNDIVVDGNITMTGGLDMEDGTLQASNLDVDGLNVASNLVVDGDSAKVLLSDLECASNIVCGASGVANMLFAGSRIGIGGGQDTASDWPQLLDNLMDGRNLDRGARNLSVADKLVLGTHDDAWQAAAKQNSGGVMTVAYAGALRHPLLTLTSNAAQGGNGRMKVDGDLLTTGAVLSLSDVSHKEDIAPIEGALEKVKLIRGYTFATIPTPDPSSRQRSPPFNEEYNGDDKVNSKNGVFDSENDNDEKNRSVATYKHRHHRRRHAGVLAQDVRDVHPEAVYEDATSGALCVAYGNMLGLLVEAVKDLEREVVALRSAFKKGRCAT